MWCGVVALLLGASDTVRAELPGGVAGDTPVLTNIFQIWQLPRAQRSQLHRIRTEVVVYYCDPAWNAAWGECNGEPTYLPFADAPVKFSAGQRVLIDGMVMPAQERLIWDRTRIEILETNVVLQSQSVASLSENPQALKSKLISVEGLVEQQLVDATHITFSFLAGGISARVFVHKEATGTAPARFKEGDFVRINCVYAPQFNRNGTISQLSLWVAKPEDIVVVGSLDTDPRFSTPVVASEIIQDDTPTNDLFHVQGIVRSHEPGKSVTLWDDTGQIMVQSDQTQPLQFGDRVEAIGYPLVLGVQQCLRGGVYRLMSSNSLAAAAVTNRSVIRLAEQVRDLSRDAARKNPEVVLRGILTWRHTNDLFTYIQDASGGIRVAKPSWAGRTSSSAGTIVIVHGQVAEGDFVPVITNAVISRSGWWNIDEVRPVTLEQAMTGLEDGRWVEMRGYVRLVVKKGPLTYLELSTSSGMFKVETPSSQPYDYLKGAIIRVQGVCDAITDMKHRLIGIQLLSPETKYITIEELAPADLFAVPLRTMDSLRRFNLQNILNERVRIIGTVVLHVPGRHLYLQDGGESVFVLSQQTNPLHPGDQVEVVGLMGIEGRRFLLREAAYRPIASGQEPPPVPVPAAHTVSEDMEGLLATAQGTLINFVVKDGVARLLIKTRESAFEASLPEPGGHADNELAKFEIGSQLTLTGVYEIQRDDYGQPTSFVLRLRSWNDIRLLQRPPWWTPQKMLWLLLGLIGVAVIALIWGLAISRKNQLLKRVQAELQTANDGLELRVQERTRELEHQVASKEVSRAELAEAQKILILTSHKAGMAEVATGILHNVGNVLNSVNISVSLLADRIRDSRADNVVKAGALLQQNAGQADFLTQDPRGVQLPAYLLKLGENLVGEKQKMEEELASLVKSVDHLKVIIAMQQDYAKVGGVLETLNVEDLVEDAIRINSAALERHAIQLVRDYQPLPQVLLDRHKVLQILVNLITNAKNALTQKTSGKQIVVRLAAGKANRFCISVSDNGTGIAPEHVGKIFSPGFTTRKEGHGYGLHNAANAAQELHGSLTLHSEGVGRGVTFTLELPCQAKESGHE